MNLSEAYLRLALPHWLMRKYIGTRPTSQKRKKMIRSSDIKTPSIPISSIKKSAMYMRTRSLMPKEARIANGVRIAVSSIMLTLMPSTPR